MESDSAAKRLEVGLEFAGRYRVIRPLSSGGMGSVYEVVDQKTDRLRALKVMLPRIAADEDMRRRFLQEASVVGRVHSDHVVEVTDAGVEDDTPFLVMELLLGEDLGTQLEQNGPFEPARVVETLTQVARGLEKVHEEGVIHRDLKPENLFATTRDDGTLCVKILDFGVAKVVSQLATLNTTRSLGTPLFMAPEQLTGDRTIAATADLYALAHVAYALLVGKPYWYEEARSASNAYAFVNTVVDGCHELASQRAERFDVSLPEAFDRWFEKATEKDVARRFETATDQSRALARLFDLATSTSAPPAPAPTVPSGRLVLAAVGLLCLVGLIAIPFVVASDPEVAPADADDSAREALPAPSASTASSAPPSAASPSAASPTSSAAPPSPPPPVASPRPRPRPPTDATAPPSEYDPLDEL